MRADDSAGRQRHVARLALTGVLGIAIGLGMYAFAIALSLARLALPISERSADVVAAVLWASGFPTSVGLILVLVDLFVLLPRKRNFSRRIDVLPATPTRVAVALMAYNDEASIGAAVADFRSSPLVSRVIVVENNSTDRTAERAAAAGAEVITEGQQGYGSCVFRCLDELTSCDEPFVALCEGDMTFRARDLEKLLAFAHHADIVNGTRVVEQLRAVNTQLSTFIYYGNFFVGKLLEIKHLGRGTFTDVGTTYKLIRRDVLPRLLRGVNPAVNLEFNAHFMDRCLSLGFTMVECPITFHPRIGQSKGGNTSNVRALKVGCTMIVGLLSDWRFWPQSTRVPTSAEQRALR